MVGLLTMLVALYTAVNERRHEVAILRAVGMPNTQIMLLFVAEAVVIATAATLLGFAAVYGGLLLAHGAVERATGIPLMISGPSTRVLLYGAATIALSALVGLVPAWRAYRTSLADGLRG